MERISGGFFNATLVDGTPDRVYMTSHVNDFLEGLVSRSGIYATISSACQVVTGSGMTVIVKTGRGMVNGHWFEIERDTTLALSQSDVVLGRIDRVVVRLDMTERTIVLDVKEGIYSESPVGAELTRNADVFEICLAEVKVNKNVSSITTSNITDTRSNTDVCGWIVGLINEFDTTELFNQYQSAQETFISEKTVEFDEWFEKAKNNEETFSEEKEAEFDEWFNTVQDTVRATSLYREYSSRYTTVQDGEQVFAIPDSLHYVNDGLDILSVYVNGWRLPADSFEVSATEVILSNPTDYAGTEIELVNKKCVEGAVSESAVQRLEVLEEKLNELTEADEYVCTGTDDNISLSEIVKAFLDGTGEYAGVADTASLNIKVVGNLGVSSLIEDTVVFDFNSATSSNRRVYVDFSSATIPTIAFTATTLGVFSAVSNVYIMYATVKANYSTAGTFYGFHGGNAKDCKVIINGSANEQTIYGGYACDELSNNEITLAGSTAEANKYGVYSCTKVLTNTINMSVGVSIMASGNQLLIGNIINTTILKSDSVVELGTLTV